VVWRKRLWLYFYGVDESHLHQFFSFFIHPYFYFLEWKKETLIKLLWICFFLFIPLPHSHYYGSEGKKRQNRDLVFFLYSPFLELITHRIKILEEGMEGREPKEEELTGTPCAAPLSKLFLHQQRPSRYITLNC
jgi:hypothetical protein